VIYGVAEERDVLPRHLRAFAAELLLAVARAGLSPKDAAALVASSRGKRAPVGKREPES